MRSIELFLIDANGVPRGKLLHRDELLAVYESGRPLPSTILGLTINGDDVEETGLVWDVGDADCWTFPLPGSLTLQTLAAVTDRPGAGKHASRARATGRGGRSPACVAAGYPACRRRVSTR